jgi:hypothetical protein
MADTDPPTVRYYVVLRGGGWEVLAECHYAARFSRQADAVRQAIDWAQLDGAGGRPALVLDDAGLEDFKPAWTYGQDPYPPKG